MLIDWSIDGLLFFTWPPRDPVVVAWSTHPRQNKTVYRQYRINPSLLICISKIPHTRWLIGSFYEVFLLWGVKGTWLYITVNMLYNRARSPEPCKIGPHFCVESPALEKLPNWVLNSQSYHSPFEGKKRGSTARLRWLWQLQYQHISTEKCCACFVFFFVPKRRSNNNLRDSVR